MSTMKETGSIKFNCNWIQLQPMPFAEIEELNNWRDQLHALQLIGENADCIGYGNISRRYKENTFIISGSATGKIQQLNESHYSLVTAYDLDSNSLTTEGPILASSESMTHAVIYESLPGVNFVFHVHHLALWKKLLQTNPSTSADVEYGTPAMAREIQRLLKATDLASIKLFAMGGHEEGIISFASNAAEAGALIIGALEAIQ